MIILLSISNAILGIKIGDLCGSRTRVVGMKTRCTNRYTKRPAYIIITKILIFARVGELGVVGVFLVGGLGEKLD